MQQMEWTEGTGVGKPGNTGEFGRSISDIHLFQRCGAAMAKALLPLLEEECGIFKSFEESWGLIDESL